MKKKILLFMLFVIMLIPMKVRAANIIYSINMDIDIDKFGNATITETWDVDADNGTEWYKVWNSLDGSKVSNYVVTMDDKALTYKEWNIHESLEQKKGYYGINSIDDGVELCFGKYDYNRHVFKLSYTMSDFIINTSDSQVLQWQLIRELEDVDFRNFSVVVHSYYEFPDTLPVWGYGAKGYTYVKDGKIEMSNSEDTDMNGEYYSMLVKFPVNTFNTDHYKEGFDSFDDVYNKAQEGTYNYDYGDTKKETFWTKLGRILSSLLMYVLPILGIVGIGVAASKNGYGYKDNKVIDKKNVPMFRDIPCNKDIYYANALINLNNFDYKDTNIFGAIILKWIRRGKITFKNEKKGIFNKETSMIDLTLNPTFDDDLESELFDIMYKASGDGLLEPKELEKWARNHYDKFLGLFTRIKDNKINELKTQGHVYHRVTKDECKKKNVMDDMIYNDSTQLYGLKKFLLEFSDMKNKEAIEVQLWDEYLMFAYLFGIAEKVAKQFKNLYPEVVREMEASNIDYSTFVYINNISTKTVHAASAARSAAENYSAGGGGFNVGGGGGGFSGGGGGFGGGSR